MNGKSSDRLYGIVAFSLFYEPWLDPPSYSFIEFNAEPFLRYYSPRGGSQNVWS